MSNQYPATTQVPKSPIDTDINKAVLDLLAKINDTNNYTDSQIKDVQDSISLIAHPIGEVQVQFPGQATPKTLYGGSWINITSTYAGLFFRAEGGNSLAFNAGTQDFSLQYHWHNSYYNAANGPGGGTAALFATSGANSSGPTTSPIPREAISDGTHGAVKLDIETRPVNQSIRIWKRSA